MKPSLLERIRVKYATMQKKVEAIGTEVKGLPERPTNFNKDVKPDTDDIRQGYEAANATPLVTGSGEGPEY